MTGATHTVVCCGERHAITIDKQGCLHRTCGRTGCQKAFATARALLKYGRQTAPGESWGARWRLRYDAAEAKRKARADNRTVPTREKNARERLITRTEQEVRASLEQCTYRRGMRKAAVGIAKDVHHPGVYYGACPQVFTQPKHSNGLSLIRIVARTDPVLWLRLTRAVPGGLVREGRDTRLAVAVLGTSTHSKSEQRRDLIVAAGKRIRGHAVETFPATIRQHGDHWSIIRWLRWDMLPDEAVSLYASKLYTMIYATSPDSDLLVRLRATCGRERWADIRHEIAKTTSEPLRANLHDLRALEGQVRRLPTADMLFAARIAADEALRGYTESLMGQIAGCTGVCLHCMQCAECHAVRSLEEAEQAIRQHASLCQQLVKLENTVSSQRRIFLAYGFTEEELETVEKLEVP